MAIISPAAHSSRPVCRWFSAPAAASLALVTAVLLAVTLLPACGGGAEGGSAGERRGGPGMGRGPGMGPPELPEAAVAVQAAWRGDIASHYTANATLDPEKEAEVLARVSGVVVRILAEEGDFVRKGQELLHIEDAEYRYKLQQAEVEADKQRTRFERAEKMFGQNLISAEDFDAARSDLNNAEAALDLARLDLSYTKVAAPFAGRVVARVIDLGETVSNGTPLFTLSDMRRLLARVHVPAKEFRNIEEGQPVKLTIDSTRTSLEGKIWLISPVIDRNSGTIKTTVEITDYPPDTRPGDFAEVSIETDRHMDTVLVPKISVVTEKGEQVVYVDVDGKAERRVVTLGFQDELEAEILDGVKEGEPVVVQGQRSLQDGQPLKIMDRLTFDDEAGRPEPGAAGDDAAPGGGDAAGATEEAVAGDTAVTDGEGAGTMGAEGESGEGDAQGSVKRPGAPGQAGADRKPPAGKKRKRPGGRSR